MGPAHPVVRERLREAGIPLLHGLRPALVALRRAAWWRAWRPRTPAPPPQRSVGWSELNEQGPILSEAASRTILAAYDVPLVPGDLAATVDEAVVLAERLGFPVVMKADVPGVAHKSAAGLVAVGVAGTDSVRDTFLRLTTRAETNGTPARGVLVEATAAGVEVICGMRHDPLFGAVVLLGVGGTLTEVLKDVSVRLVPPSKEDLDEMLEECAVGRLLARAGGDAGALRATVAGLARLAVEHPEIREVDVNPIFVSRDGTAAADALVVLGSESGAPS
jgi:acyl-CoA synthetase (NDP forming)